LVAIQIMGELGGGAMSRSDYRAGFGGLYRGRLQTGYSGVLSGVFYIKRNRHPYLSSFKAGAQPHFVTY
jgi:hypothetical protein